MSVNQLKAELAKTQNHLSQSNSLNFSLIEEINALKKTIPGQSNIIIDLEDKVEKTATKYKSANEARLESDARYHILASTFFGKIALKFLKSEVPEK